MSSFALKLLAALFMLIDHTGDAIIGKYSFLNLIGRMAFPIFCFQLVQGYIHTKDKKKHLSKLLLFAIISQIPFSLFQSTYTTEFHVNVLFTMFIGTLAIYYCEKNKNKYLKIVIVIIASILNELIKADYGYFGVILISVIYYFEASTNIKNKKIKQIIAIFLLCNLRYIPRMIAYPQHMDSYFLQGIFTSLSVIFICLYNHKEGPKLKYFFYIFYPLHMLILYFIHNAI